MPQTSLPDLSGRITLVTGASRGIGWQACLSLAQAGSHVIAVGRTQGALEELDDTIRAAGGECTLVPMDLRQFDGIDMLGKQIHERWGRLDGLFGNAGVLGEVAQSHRAYWGAYAASKAALDAFVTCYANETTKTNLKVNMIDPGAMRTQMRAKAMPGEDPAILPEPSQIAPLITHMLSPDYDKTAQRLHFRDSDFYKS